MVEEIVAAAQAHDEIYWSAHDLKIDLLLSPSGYPDGWRQAREILDQLIPATPDAERVLNYQGRLLQAYALFAEVGEISSVQWAMDHGWDIVHALQRRSRDLRWAYGCLNIADSCRMNFANDRAERIEQAIKLMYEVNEVAISGALPAGHNILPLIGCTLAHLYSNRIAGDRLVNLEAAISAVQPYCQDELRVREPNIWAICQQAKGVAFLERVAGDFDENIEEAINALQSALAVSRSDIDRRNWGTINNDLSAALLVRKGSSEENAQEAFVAAENALGCFTADQSPDPRVRALMNLSQAATKRANPPVPADVDLAIVMLGEALSILGEEPKWRVADIKARIGEALSYRQDDPASIDASMAAFRESLDIIETSPLEARKRASTAAFTAERLKRWKDAANFYQAALQANEVILEADVSDESKLAELARMRNVYGSAAVAYAQAGDLPEQVAAAEAGRARTLADALESRLAERELKARYPAEYQTFAAARDALGRVMSTARDIPANPASAITFGPPTALVSAGTDAWAYSLYRDYSDALDAVRRLPGMMAFLRQPEPLDLAALLQETDAALVYSHAGRSDCLHLIVTRGTDRPSIQAVLAPYSYDDLVDSLVGSQSGDSLQASFAAGALTGGIAFGEALNELMSRIRDDLMQPLADALQETGITRATLIPGGLLGLLPLHAALLDSVEVSYAPSARVLAKLVTPARPQHHSLVIGNPTGDIPFSAQEAENVAKMLGAQPLLSKMATRQAVLDGLQSATIVHLACHGIYDQRQPLSSSILLADGNLTLAELLHGNLFENVELVVASACQTAMISMGETADELLSLLSGFLRAGARAVVGTLWPVPDQSTALLIFKFYEAWLAGQTVAGALRSAQRWLRDSTVADLYPIYDRLGTETSWLEFFEPHEKLFDHPSYWAPFVAVGDWPGNGSVGRPRQ
jgi:tetratricopeptide (TPR) repeat protein